MSCCNRADRLGSHAGVDPFHLPDPERHFAPDLGLEPVHLDIALGFDLAGKQAAGAVTITVRAHRAERELELDAVEFVDVDVVDPDGHPLTFSYDGTRLTVTWETPLERGEERRAEVRYRVISPLTGMEFSWPDEAHPDRAKFMVTDHETERARFWLPCIDHPTVRTPVDFHLRAGSEYTVLANGLRTDVEDHGDGTQTVHWSLEQPCPSYLICLAVGEFVRADGGEFDGREVAFFAPAPYTAEDLERSFGPTRSMMEWMTERLDAAFPFGKYFQLAVPSIGGAMENISLTTWDAKWIADPLFHAERGWLIDLVNLHEMAHSYFGDAIVVRDFAHVWLKESWATYMESAWLEETQGLDAMHWQLSEEVRAYRNEADKRYVRPIVTRAFDSSWDMYDGHLYPGGAVRLHMLRQELGDDDFWGAVSDYVRLFSGRVVETSDFRRTLEARSGRSLSEFFEQWFERPGYPKLEATFKHSRTRGEAIVTVEQKQVDAERGVGLFSFTLEVDVEHGDGTWTTAELEVSERKHSLVLELEDRPLQVVIDPRGKVLASLEWRPGLDLLKRALAEAPTVPGRIQAARSLSRMASRSAIAALRERFAREPHFGVRIEIARSLGAAGTETAADALCELLSTETDPRAMGEVATACGNYREPTIAAALTEWLGRTELPYLARGNALVALGRQRGEAHLETLKAAALDRSWWGWVRRAAMTAVGQTRTEAGRSWLLGKVARGTDAEQVRVVAIAALAEAARWQPDAAKAEVIERLADLTRDPDLPIRGAATAALRSMGDLDAIPALEKAAASLAPQSRPRVQRMISSLRATAGKGSEASKLRKQIEELNESLRKLTHRVGVMEERAKASSDDADWSESR